LQGLAKLIVRELEDLARIKGYKYALLETGIRQHEAINLYKNNGYNVIQNYGPYIVLYYILSGISATKACAIAKSSAQA
jgi:GNAT superfamily N-acetyltransferase